MSPAYCRYGCIVNGRATLVIPDCRRQGEALIFPEGKIIRKVAETGLLNAFQEELQTFLDEIKQSRPKTMLQRFPAAGGRLTNEIIPIFHPNIKRNTG